MKLMGIHLWSPNLIPDGVTELECFGGVRVAAGNPNDVMFRELYLNHVYQDDVLIALRGLLTPGCVFWDVGANHGYMSICAEKLLAGEIQILAFEPNAEVAEALRHNLELNRCGRVEAHDICLAEKPRRVTLHFHKNNSLNASIEPRFAGPGPALTKLEMDAVPLDNLVQSLPPPDVLKIDVEGAEHLVLEGGRKFLSSRHPAIVVGFNEVSLAAAGLTPEEFFELFRSLGYEAHQLLRPWIGMHRWERRKRIRHPRGLRGLCNLVLLPDNRDRDALAPAPGAGQRSILRGA
jgi:FkbM family methyltransferase